MARLVFASYMPDVLDLNAPATRSLSNVIPRGDGFGPFRDISAFTAVLPAACRGYIVARDPADGTVAIFAGTSTKLYKLDNTYFTWTDVSKAAGTYTALSSDAHWTFAQYGSRVIASQKNYVMQTFTLGSSTAFADLAGTPPQAGWVAVIANHVVATDISGAPGRVQWSAFGDPTGWTAGTNLSDIQDLPNLGNVKCAEEIGNLVGVILQDQGIRRMVYAPGSDLIFQIEVLRTDVGILAPHSLAIAAGHAFFLSTKGFAQLGLDGSLLFIGEERVDRTVLGQHNASAPADVLALAYDSSAPQLVIGVSDPRRNLYMCSYKSQNGAPGLFDKAVVYQWSLQRWSPVSVSGEYLEHVSIPGLTLEALDAIAPGAQAITGAASNGGPNLIRITVASTSGWTTGDRKTITGVLGTTEANGTWTITVINSTHIDLQGSTFTNAYSSAGVVGGSVDAMTLSFDEISTASLLALSGFNSSHKLGLFSGDTLEAVVSSAEQQIEGQRADINGIRPITDAATAYAAILARENMNAAPSVGTESLMDSDGYCPLLNEGNLIRARIRIPAGILWNYATGIELDAIPSGGTREF